MGGDSGSSSAHAALPLPSPPPARTMPTPRGGTHLGQEPDQVLPLEEFHFLAPGAGSQSEAFPCQGHLVVPNILLPSMPTQQEAPGELEKLCQPRLQLCPLLPRAPAPRRRKWGMGKALWAPTAPGTQLCATLSAPFSSPQGKDWAGEQGEGVVGTNKVAPRTFVQLWLGRTVPRG